MYTDLNLSECWLMLRAVFVRVKFLRHGPYVTSWSSNTFGAHYGFDRTPKNKRNRAAAS